MAIETIADRVIKSITDNLCALEFKVAETHKLIDDLSMESLDIVELSMDLEDEFGIEIDDESWSKMQGSGITVRDVIDFITPRVTK